MKGPIEWADLRERLEEASRSLDKLKNDAARMHHKLEYSRLDGKQDGIKVALSYMDEYDR